ncbi:MAG: DNA polymerase III subunit gamma/tau [Deltaproteobacteria bacterium]|nr:DNA polymerase III subunit gamma/tau [Deltaproteobacteria bacterium]
MAYEALSRKWRPKTFGEVVGQRHVTRALANALSRGKIHHAYMFTGTRGVGKTTFARILARALNCEEGPTPTPCLSCPACVEILAGSSVDVQEIDGASNTGIDDVRRLRENAAYTPARSRYKVYIIDEVHMLSKAAFNGLLKILEEPPAHVIFVFATTEPNRIPDTILSRVQRFDFRMLTDEEIFTRLREMAEAESISFEEEALRLVAQYAFGSMRDGQSIIEQAAVSGDGRIQASLVEEILGLVGTDAAIDLVHAVVAEGMEEAIRKFASLQSRGADLKFLFLSLVDVLRDAAVWKFTEKDELLFRHSPSSLARMKELCALRAREEWMFLLDIAFRSEKDVLGTEFPRLGFELLLLRLVNAPGLLAVEGLAGEKSTAALAPSPSLAAVSPPDAPSQKARTTVSKRVPAGEPPGGDAEVWEGIRRSLEGKKKPLLVALLHQMRGRLEGGEMVIACPHQMQLDRLREEDKWPVLVQAVEEVVGSGIPIRLLAEPEKKSPAGDGPGGGKSNPEKMALADPLLAEVLREFEGATVLEVLPGPRRMPIPAVANAEGQEPDEGAEEAEEPE